MIPVYQDPFSLLNSQDFINKWISKISIGDIANCDGSPGDLFCECLPEDTSISDPLERLQAQCNEDTLLCGPYTGACVPVLDPFIVTPPENFLTEWTQYNTRRNVPLPTNEENYTQSAFSYVSDRTRFRSLVGFNGTYNPTAGTCTECRISWLIVKFTSIIDTQLGSFELESHYQQWEDVVSAINEDPDRPVEAGDCIQYNSGWLLMQTEVTAVTNISTDFVITIVTAFLSLAVFTANMVVTAFGMTSLLLCMCSIFSFFQWFGWQLGIIEALSASVLVGLCVDYVFHLGEVYVDTPASDSRNTRLRQGLTRMGFSILTGALTTSVANAALLLCKIQIFFKFGVLMTISTSFSIIYTLVLFAAFLSKWGPTGRWGQLPFLEKIHCGDHDIDQKSRIDPAIFEGSKAAQ